MSIVLPVLLLCAGILLWVFTLITVRNPREHWWGSELLTATVYVPGVIGFAVIGLILFIQFFFIHPDGLTLVPMIISAVIAAATTVVIKLLGIKQRLARYEQQSSNAELLKMPTPPQPGKPDQPVAKAA